MNIEQFFTLLISSEIFTPQDAHRFAADYYGVCSESGEPPTAESFGEFLEAAGHLTRWQRDKLMLGKWKGFRLDEYLLIGRVDRGENDVLYKARDTRNDTIVHLVVWPKNGLPEYRIEKYTE